MIELAFAFEISAQVGQPLEAGQTPRGRRRVVPILGGAVEGPRLRGRVLPGGADRQFNRADGLMVLEARYEIESDDGVLISVVNRGLRRASEDALRRLIAGEAVDPAEVYCRTTPVFEAPEGAYAWLNESVFVGSAVRHPESVTITVYEAR
jgi:hypothetical protein